MVAGPPNKTLFVAGLNLVQQPSAQELGNYFETRFGPIVRADVTRTKANNSPIAFVEFVYLQDAERAWSEAHQSYFQNNKLIVEYAKGQPSENWKAFNSSNTTSSSPSNSSRPHSSNHYSDEFRRGSDRDYFNRLDSSRGRSPTHHHHHSDHRDRRDRDDDYRRRRSRSRSRSPYRYSSSRRTRSYSRSRSRSRSPPPRRRRDRTPVRRSPSRSPPPPYNKNRAVIGEEVEEVARDPW